MLPEDIRNKKVMIAPLDWGMGHVTRSLALIKDLVANGNELVFAGTKEQIQIAKQDYPDLTYELIAGYDITLDSAKSTYWQMITQSAKMQKSIKQEEEVAQSLALKYGIDIIISDNRYGFKSSKCENIILTHQLSPPVPTLRKAVRAQVVKWVNKFDFCWVPDHESNPICGDLNQVELKIPKLKIGPLSRMNFEELTKDIDVLLISSGPEPERSKFEKAFLVKLKSTDLLFKVVGQSAIKEDFYVNNPSGKELEKLINSSKKVISRAGYTAIMELTKLKAAAILVPTKGQYEQEFLASHVKNDFLVFVSEKTLLENFTSFID
ncbi:MAG: hypothetical protein BM555_03265 [Crocinitomix sp. MedPE-SWsnd]|nr:MAG: hypothetical protein BM555_03265 [Crocinitomix sp. MedPE-SWsnd]